MNYSEAMKWSRKAVEQGNPTGQSNIALMYASGLGVRQDDNEAAKWSRMAADQGDATAQTLLGMMSGTGKGVPQDFVQAHKWLSLAAMRFPAPDNEDREKAVNARDQLAALMTPAQIAEAEQLAREWKPK